jgi:hypothetical protein
MLDGGDSIQFARNGKPSSLNRALSICSSGQPFKSAHRLTKNTPIAQILPVSPSERLLHLTHTNTLPLPKKFNGCKDILGIMGRINDIIPPLCFIFQSWGGLFVSTWGIITLVEKENPQKAGMVR